MATTYRKAAPDDGADALVERLIRTQHQELKNCGVTIQVMLAHAATNEETGQTEGPAVLLHGYPCCAIVKVNSLKDRAEGKRDATITLDGDNWKDWPEPKRLAILDHELQHLQLTGKVDDCGRPKLKVRLHDWQLGGFHAIVQRHEAEAVEYQQIAAAWAKVEQQTFGWDDSPARRASGARTR